MEGLRRVLIVEDTDYMQEMFREIVTSVGYKPEVASTVGESLTKLARMLFHVALIDLRLDDTDPRNFDGLKVLTHIKNMDEGTKAIVLTAYGEVESAAEAFREYGVLNFIRKNQMQIVQVKESIQAAAEQACLDMMQPARQLQATTLIRSHSVPKLLQMLGCEKEPLEGFLHQCLCGLQPLLPTRETLSPVQTAVGPIIQLRYWSKILGEPLMITFGRPDAMQIWRSQIGQTGELLREIAAPERSQWHAVVHVLTGVPFEEFE
jgi:ActR/RegA family two-component response regulator